MDKQLVISFKTIVLTVLLLIGVYLVYKLGSAISVVFIAALIAVALEPAVKFFMKARIKSKTLPRGFSVLITYLLVLITIGLVLTVGLPVLVVQSQKLLQALIQIMSDSKLFSQVNINATEFLPQLTKISGGVLTVTVSIFSNITAIISLIILSMYMSFDWENIKTGFLSFFPDDLEDTVSTTLQEIETTVGQWVKGQLMLMLIVGLVSFIGLQIMGVKYALPLAVVSGLLEIVPIIGPILSAVIAGIVGFSDSSWKGIGVVALYTVIQQAENSLLVPKIMQKVSGFSPLVIMLALLVGSSMFGIVGAIVAVPVTMILTIIVKKLLNAGNI